MALVASLAAGLAVMLSGLWILALMPMAVASLLLITAALKGMAPVPALSGVALLAAGLATLQQCAGAGAFLFLAAGLLGFHFGEPIMNPDWGP